MESIYKQIERRSGSEAAIGPFRVDVRRREAGTTMHRVSDRHPDQTAPPDAEHSPALSASSPAPNVADPPPNASESTSALVEPTDLAESPTAPVEPQPDVAEPARSSTSVQSLAEPQPDVADPARSGTSVQSLGGSDSTSVPAPPLSAEPMGGTAMAALPGMAELDDLAAELDAIDATLARLDRNGEPTPSGGR